MADNHFAETVEALFKGMDQFVTTKTVVGEAVKVDDAIILPLVDVTCGMAAGSFADNAKQNGGGGMSAKMSPSAVLVNKFTGGQKEVSKEAVETAETIAENAKEVTEK